MGDGAFEPPSDFEPEGASGGGSNIWMWIGVGCLGLLILAGGALSFGAYKTVSCCQSTIQNQRRAVETGLAFGRHLSNLDYKAAWAETTPRYQDETTFADFRARFEPYRRELKAAHAHVQGVRTRMEENSSYYQITIGLTPSESKTQIVLSLEVVSLSGGSVGADRRVHRVDAFSLKRRKRTPARERAGMTVHLFHRTLAAGVTESAYTQRMSDDARNAGSFEAFQTFVDEHGLAVGPDAIQIQAVHYRQRGSALVMIEYTPRADDAGTVRRRRAFYRLGQVNPLSWKIEAIKPASSASVFPSSFELNQPSAPPTGDGRESEQRDAGSPETNDAVGEGPSRDAAVTAD